MSENAAEGQILGSKFLKIILEYYLFFRYKLVILEVDAVPIASSTVVVVTNDAQVRSAKCNQCDTGNDAERCLQSDVRLDIDATCTLPSPRRDVYKRQRHSGVQQTAYCHAHSDITSLKTDDVNAAAQTATTSGLSTVLGLLDHVPLFYIALTSGASFAACVSSVYPSSVVAVVAMTSFVSFAFSSARRYVISHQLALR